MTHTPTPRFEMKRNKANDEWIIWDNNFANEGIAIKLMGFTSDRSAIKAIRELNKNPNWRG